MSGRNQVRLHLPDIFEFRRPFRSLPERKTAIVVCRGRGPSACTCQRPVAHSWVLPGRCPFGFLRVSYPAQEVGIWAVAGLHVAVALGLFFGPLPFFGLRQRELQLIRLHPVYFTFVHAINVWELYIDLPGRSDKYSAYTRKTKILEKWRFISRQSLVLARYTWLSDAPTSLTRLKNTFSGGLQSRLPWLR